MVGVGELSVEEASPTMNTVVGKTVLLLSQPASYCKHTLDNSLRDMPIDPPIGRGIAYRHVLLAAI